MQLKDNSRKWDNTTLEEALNSVVDQTHKTLDINIVDDGSTDDSAEICDEYAGKDERITVIHQQNKGLRGAKNVGFYNMKGDYVSNN